MRILLAGVALSARHCGRCGGTDRYPSGKCRPCTQERGRVLTESGYWSGRNTRQREEAELACLGDEARTGVIYGLFHPVTGALRYVGQTQAGLNRRLSGHVAKALRGDDSHLPVMRWVVKLKGEGLEPTIQLLDGPMHVVQLDQAERDMIAAKRGEGHDLLNVDAGGMTKLRTWGQTPESIERSAAAKRGKPRSPETRAKLSAANTGRKQPHDVVERRIASNRGRKQSPEWIAARVSAIAATKARKKAAAAAQDRS